jgi:hypothetical protein
MSSEQMMSAGEEAEFREDGFRCKTSCPCAREAGMRSVLAVFLFLNGWLVVSSCVLSNPFVTPPTYLYIGLSC